MSISYMVEGRVLNVSNQQIGLYENNKELLTVTLTKSEMIILCIILKNSSAVNPISNRSIDEIYTEKTGGQLSVYSLKNNLANIRKKCRTLSTALLPLKIELELIINLNRVGYYCPFKKDEDRHNYSLLENNVSFHIPFRIRLARLYTYCIKSVSRKGLLKQLRLFIYILIVIIVLIFSLLLHVAVQIIDDIDETSKYLLQNFEKNGCELNLSNVLTKSKSTSMAIINVNYDYCVVKLHSVYSTASLGSPASNYRKSIPEIMEKSYSVRGVYDGINLTTLLPEKYLYAQAGSLSLFTFPFISDFILIQDNVQKVKSDENYLYQENDSVTFQLTKDTKLGIKFDNMLINIMSLFLLFITLINSRWALRNIVYLFFSHNMKYQSKAIINTQTDTILYFEVIAKLEKRVDTAFINRMNLLGFHVTSILDAMINKSKLIESNSLGINLSVQCLLNDYTYNKIQSQIFKLLDNSSVLFLELNESNVRLNNEEYKIVKSRINKLKAHGCTIVLDNFGTGSNNIDRLLQIKPHYVKFHKSLNDNIEHDRTQAALLENLVKVCNSHGIEAIVKGVERSKQSYILTKSNCLFQQGELFKQ